MQSYKRLDFLYIFAVFVFCMLWISSLTFAATVEWFVLLLAFFLQSYAISRWQHWMLLRDTEREMPASVSSGSLCCLQSMWHSHIEMLSVTFFLLYILLNIVTIFIIAPLASDDQGIDELVTTPPFAVLIACDILFVSIDWGLRLKSQTDSDI